MAEVVLKAEKRSIGTHSKINTSRKQGKIPGVFYLHNTENIPIQAEALALRPIVYTAEAHIINLQLEDATERKCIVREIQFDPITDRVIHFDLMGLRAGEKIRLEVPILLEGAAIGVREGGIVQHTLHRVEVECLPADLPQHITVNIDNLHIGDAVKVGDLKIDGVEFTFNPDQSIVSIVHPKVVAEATPAVEGEAEAAPAEPEVITKGKKEEEEG